MLVRSCSSVVLLLVVLNINQAHGQCTKDVDCKGDRICDSGQCHSPGSGNGGSGNRRVINGGFNSGSNGGSFGGFGNSNGGSGESDVEWKKGRTTLIRNMHRATASPSPINLLTQGSLHLYHKYKDRQLKNEHYRKMKKDALAGLARKKRKGKITPVLQRAGSDVFSAVESGASPSSASTPNLRDRQFLENAIKWDPIVRKYRSLRGETPE